MRIDRDQRNMLLGVGAVALLFIGAFWLPQALRQHRLQKQIEASQTELAELVNQNTKLASVARQVGLLEQQLINAPRKIAEESEMADLLRRLSTQLTLHQVGDPQVLTQPLKVGTDFRLMPTDLEFQGSFPAVFGFLKYVESMDRLVRVRHLKLVVDLDDPLGTLKARVELSTYFTPPEAQP